MKDATTGTANVVKKATNMLPGRKSSEHDDRKQGSGDDSNPQHENKQARDLGGESVPIAQNNQDEHLGTAGGSSREVQSNRPAGDNEDEKP